MVWFNIDNQSGEDITVTELGLNISNATNVNVYRKAGTHVGFETNAGAWTLVGTADANTGPFSGPFPGNGTITPASLPTTTNAEKLNARPPFVVLTTRLMATTFSFSSRSPAFILFTITFDIYSI